MIEWKGLLERELSEQDAQASSSVSSREEDDENHTKVIPSIIAEGLGPLGKYTRGGQRQTIACCI